jgi:predicted transcriptional regulator
MNDGDIIQVAHVVLNVGGLNIFGEKFGNYSLLELISLRILWGVP